MHNSITKHIEWYKPDTRVIETYHCSSIKATICYTIVLVKTKCIENETKKKSSFYLRHEESKTLKYLQILWKKCDHNGFVKMLVSWILVSTY